MDQVLGPFGHVDQTGKQVSDVRLALVGPDVMGQFGEPPQGGSERPGRPVLLHLLVQFDLNLVHVRACHRLKQDCEVAETGVGCIERQPRSNVSRLFN